MEEAVLVNLDLTLNAGVVQNPENCLNWEVFCTEECTLPCDILNEEPSQENCSIPVVGVKKRNCPTWRAGIPEQNQVRVPQKGNGPPAKKEIGPDCGCSSKCFEKIGTETIQKIFRNFWALADYNSQNAYLFGLIDLVRVKRRYTKKETSRRNFTIFYHVKDKGRNVGVCKKAFLNIHGLQRNRGRINNLANKMKEGESVPPPDRRGRHANRPNAYSQEAVEHVRQHLLTCPKVDKKKNFETCPSKQMVLSAKRCYTLYVNEYCKNNKLVPVSLDKFRRVFALEGYKNGCRGRRNVTGPALDPSGAAYRGPIVAEGGGVRVSPTLDRFSNVSTKPPPEIPSISPTSFPPAPHRLRSLALDENKILF